jgi:hypothetical protein
MTNNASAVRGCVTLGGQNITGWTAFEVDNNTFASADTFNVTFALNALPSDRDANWLSSQKSATTELYAGIPPDPSRWASTDLKRLIVGTVDTIEFDLVAGTVHIGGRDFTQRLIDEKSTAKFQNKTASQIAIALAMKHGLTPVVTETTGSTIRSTASTCRTRAPIGICSVRSHEPSSSSRMCGATNCISSRAPIPRRSRRSRSFGRRQMNTPAFRRRTSRASSSSAH